MGRRTVLVTGAAGFIGYHVAQRLIAKGDMVIGLDNINNYYDVNLKKARLAQLTEKDNFIFEKVDLADRIEMIRVLGGYSPELIVHLAAQAGVRYSLENPHSYIDSNIAGFLNILEGSRQIKVRHLVYASSSSVYGANTKMPFSVHHNVDHPVSLYAASKKANELMAHSYSSLFKIPTSGLRFFTVYGPWGRPDMALFKFTKNILAGKPITVYNYGKHKRDFTYISDIVEGIIRVLDKIPESNELWSGANPDPSTSFAPYRVYNIGNGRPVELIHFIEVLEKYLGKKAVMEMEPIQPGDVPETYADVSDLAAAVGYSPGTCVEEGIAKFVEWYKSYYREG